ncbi:hypothetical protein BASA62_005677 [Batrachochytrium salamandrivorans]|nr:hypothetical protein BASA62_005677 [Batrachochytrium salamandrivorans]
MCENAQDTHPHLHDMTAWQNRRSPTPVIESLQSRKRRAQDTLSPTPDAASASLQVQASPFTDRSTKVASTRTSARKSGSGTKVGVTITPKADSHNATTTTTTTTTEQRSSKRIRRNTAAVSTVFSEVKVGSTAIEASSISDQPTAKCITLSYPSLDEKPSPRTPPTETDCVDSNAASTFDMTITQTKPTVLDIQENVGNSQSQRMSVFPENYSEYSMLARNAIMNRLRPAESSDIDLETASNNTRNAVDSIFHLINKTVESCQSNSILLVGGRGSGKSKVVKTALSRLAEKFPSIGSSKPYFVINLSGLVHVNDKRALHCIVKQLCMDTCVLNSAVSTFADTLTYMLSMLQSGTSKSTPVLFILDEIDYFALHPKQTLLYNLFDIAQKNENPIAVIGMTSRWDMVELMEKRVKSRFSHRLIHLYSENSFIKYCARLVSVFSISSRDGIKDLEYIKQFNASVQRLFSDADSVEIWNDIFDMCNTWASASQAFMPMVCKLSSAAPFFQVDTWKVISQERLGFRDQRTDLVDGLSVLELCLLIAIKCLLARQVVTFNFEMVYEEYREFAKRISTLGRASASIFYVKRVASKAFETLLEVGVLKGDEGLASKSCPKSHRLVRCMLSRRQILAAVDQYDQLNTMCPSEVVQWGRLN